MDYTFLLNMRFNSSLGVVDVAKGSWTYNKVTMTNTGRFSGECAELESDSYINKIAGDDIVLNISKSFTISFWIKQDLTAIANKDYTCLISNGNPNGKDINNTIRITKDRTLQLIDNVGNKYESADISSNFRNNNWNNFMLIKQEDSLAINFYLNGTKISTFTMKNKFQFDGYNMRIGYNLDSSLDDIVICNGSYPELETGITVPSRYFSQVVDPNGAEDILEWEDTEKIYSEYDDIVKLTEWKRFETYSAIDSRQNGLCPYLLSDIKWHLTDTYFLGGKYHVNRDYKTINISLQGIQDNKLFSNYTIEARRFAKTMEEAYNEKFCHPFLLFIDGKLIPWSYITIIRSDSYITISISELFRHSMTDDDINRLEIMCFPFEISYSERGQITEDAQILYHFNNDGTYGGYNIIIGSRESDLRVYRYDEEKSGFKNFYIDANMSNKIVKSNFAVFDSNGIFIRDPLINIDHAGNYFTLTSDYGTNGKNHSVIICFNEKENHSEDYINRLRNHTNYLKDFITADIVEPDESEIDDDSNVSKSIINVSQIRKQFDFVHTFSKDYSTNINDSIDYIFDYDKNKYDEIYEKRSPIVIAPMKFADVVHKNPYYTGTVTKDTYTVYVSPTANQIIRVDFGTGQFVESDSKTTKYIEVAKGTTYNATLTANTNYEPGNLSAKKIASSVNGSTTFTAYISSTKNQKITVAFSDGQKVDSISSGMRSVIVMPGTTYEATVTADDGYEAGDVSIRKIASSSSGDDIRKKYKYYLKFSRNIYDDKQLAIDHTECIVFVDGKVPEWYNNGDHTSQDFIFYLDDYDKNATFEVVYFRHIRNQIISANQIGAKDEYTVTVSPTENQTITVTLADGQIIKSDPANSKSITVANGTKYIATIDPNSGYNSGELYITKIETPIDELSTDIISFKDAFFIDKDDILIYTDYKGEDCMLPIRYSLDEISRTITIEDSKYLNTKLYLGSVNQFRYARVKVNQATNIIPLPEEFATCYNTKKFMIFVNGYLLNSVLYRILIPSLTESRIKSKAIYTLKTVDADDRIDIVYYGGTSFNRMNCNSDLVFKTVKIYSTEDNQDEFVIPIPFKGYQIQDKQYSGFLLFKDSVLIDDTRYYVYSKNGIYYLKMLDWEDRLFVTGDSLVFIFPYYKSDWEMDAPISTTNALQFVTRSVIVENDGTSSVEIPADLTGDIKDDKYIYIFADSAFINKDHYEIDKTNTITFNDLSFDAGTEITMIIETDKFNLSLNNVALKYTNLIVEYEGQMIFQLPFEYKAKSYILFRNGEYVDSDSYAINNDQLIFLYNYNDLVPSDELIVICSVESSTDLYTINYYQYSAIVSDPTTIDIPEYNGTNFTINNILLFVGNGLVNKNYYTVSANTIHIMDGITKVGDKVLILAAYKTLNPNTVPTKSAGIWDTNFDRVEVKATSNNQVKFKVPHPPYANFNPDYKFILLVRGSFVPELNYTISSDGKYITLDSDSQSYARSIKRGDIISFIFCTNYGFSGVNKTEYSVKMPTTKEIEFTEFNNIIDLNERIMVFYGSVFIDPSRYRVNNINKTIKFDDTIVYNQDRYVTIVTFYTGNATTGKINYLPSSGYTFFNEKEIDRNFNKGMYLFFVNGYKVIQDNLLDITNSIKKVTADIKSRYGLEVLTFSPKILEFYERYKKVDQIEQYTLTIPDTKNQIVRVTCNEITHSTTFKTDEDNKFTAVLIPNKGYSAGTITPSAGTVDKDITFTITPAKKGSLRKVKIIQSDHQLITVRCNGRTYTSDFEELDGSNWVATIRITDTGYDIGTLTKSSGTVTNGLTISASEATITKIKLGVEAKTPRNYHQYVLTDVYEMDSKKKNSYYFIKPSGYGVKYDMKNSSKGDTMSPIDIEYGSYVIFTAKAYTGYEPGKYAHLKGDHLEWFKMNTSYYMTKDFPDLIMDDPTGPYIVSISVASTQSLSNETIYVVTMDDNGAVDVYTDSFITKKNIKYAAFVVADEGYSAGELIISDNNDSDGYATTSMSITATPATKADKSEDELEDIAVLAEYQNLANIDSNDEDNIDVECICPFKDEIILIETPTELYLNPTKAPKNSIINIYLKAVNKDVEGTLYVNEEVLVGDKLTIDTTGLDKIICEVK